MMSRSSRNAAAVSAAALTAAALTADVAAQNDISAERIMAHAVYLASDELEGRAPGSRGETLTIQYLVDRFAAMGFEPCGPDGAYLQQVPLVGSTVTNSPELLVAGGSGGDISLEYGPEFVAWTLRQQALASVEATELVFVGYGVVAPEYGWDDYKGVDVAGKMIVMLVGDPPHPDQNIFAGPSMTYYGRWTYKFECAAEKGAAGAVVVHTEELAGYPWSVVESSWTGEQFDVVRADRGMSRCAVESWITESAAQAVFEQAGMSFEAARNEAASRKFRPYSLRLTGSARIESGLREVLSHNVVARLPGKDPDYTREHVIYTAHWDHLGRGKPVDGDSIYNGALDNASGVAGALEVARAFAGRRRELKRSVLFIMTTAEESGLLGARYYVGEPLLQLEYAVAMINVDGLNIWGRTFDMVIVGRGQSDLDACLSHAIAAQGRRLRPDSEPEKGYYYRSDHFPFAKAGVPALYADGGVHFRGRPDGWGMEARRRYLLDRYHKPQDEVDSSWDLSGAVEDMEALFLVGLRLATSADYPHWSDTSEFKSAGDALRSNRTR
jgi:Zn-dependent M28 family amino/carboxypeptidase